MFNLFISAAFIFFSLTGFVSAAQSKEPEAEKDTALKIVQDKCQHCHGINGEASSAIYPRLAGQHKNYILKQLHDFRSLRRKEATMNEMTANLSDAQITALAAYFSSQPAISHRVRDKQLAAVGEYIFQKGNPYSGVAPCSSCHGENGEGSELRPRLAGQHKRYVAEQLHSFTERDRTNDNAIMFSIASKLTELEVEAVANYVSGLK
ncbi:MAG: cytochrome c4 [gamma proteobacterium symbiont of Taylorina sp.]|nr:cytochrome c4 [gamma proteobacterium symbiont of Taylorina sp.]